MSHEIKVGGGLQNFNPTITRSGQMRDTVNTEVDGRPAEVSLEKPTEERFVQQTQGIGIEGNVEFGLNGQWALIGGVRISAARANFLSRNGDEKVDTPYTLLNAAPQVGARYFISPTDRNASIAALASFDVSGLSYQQNGSTKQNISTLALGLGMEVAVKPFDWLEVALQVGSATPLSNFSPSAAEARAGIVIRVPIFEFGGTPDPTIQVDAQTAAEVKEAEGATKIPPAKAPAESAKEVSPAAAPAAEPPPAEEAPPAEEPPVEEDLKKKPAAPTKAKKKPGAAKKGTKTRGGTNATSGDSVDE